MNLNILKKYFDKLTKHLNQINIGKLYEETTRRTHRHETANPANHSRHSRPDCNCNH